MYKYTMKTEETIKINSLYEKQITLIGDSNLKASKIFEKF